MKTFLEHLQEAVGGTFPIEDIINNLSEDEIVEEVKLYTLEACRESLRIASENAKYTTEDVEFCYKVIIDKQSILSEENIPKEVRA